MYWTLMLFNFCVLKKRKPRICTGSTCCWTVRTIITSKRSFIPQCSRFISAVFQMGWSMHSQIQYLRFPSDAQIRLSPSWGSLFFLCTASTRYSPATCVFCDLKSLRKAVLLQRSRAAHLRTRAFQMHRKRSGMDSLTTDDRKTPGFIKCVLVFRNRCLVLKGLFFFLFRFFLLLAAVVFSFHPSCMGSGAAGSASQRGKKRGLSDVTEKKPQQCALLSAPSRGVQQQSTSSELLCLILLCRLCLSFSQTKHKGITPKIARISGCSIKEFSWASTGDYAVSVSSSVFLWNWKGKEKPCWMTCYRCKDEKYLGPNWNHTSGVGAVYRSRLHSASTFVACVIGTFVGLGSSSSCSYSTLYTM